MYNILSICKNQYNSLNNTKHTYTYILKNDLHKVIFNINKKNNC